ncbi:MAG: hypothetical protein Q9169_007843 [Polycauliona sp. 2 TL-2023]
MYAARFLCIIGCIPIFVPAIRAFPSIPSNTSVLAAEPADLTLGAWPSREGWRMDITHDISITLKRYGPFADPSKWNDIREALNDFEQRFIEHMEYPMELPARQNFNELYSGIVKLKVANYHSWPNQLVGRELAQIVKTINNLFFVYNDNPREIDIAINKDGIHMHGLTIIYQRDRNPWPQQLPWTWRVFDLALEFWLYGRDFVQSSAFDAEFFQGLEGVRAKMINEINQGKRRHGEPPPPPAKPSYTSGIVKLDIEPPPNAGKVLINVYSMVHLLSQIRTRLITRREGLVYGPREFGANITDNRGRKLAKMFLTVIDLEEEIAQE